MMGFRTEGRETGPELGPSDTHSQTGWPVVEPATATPPEPQPAIVQLVSDVGSRLMHWAKGGTPPERPTPQVMLSAERAVLGSQEPMIDPSRCRREDPPVGDEVASVEAMIKPSRFHRAAIEAHRDDWP
jgi:hypothetical protein